MEDKNKDFLLPENGFLADEPPLMEEFTEQTPDFQLVPNAVSLMQEPAAPDICLIPETLPEEVHAVPAEDAAPAAEAPAVEPGDICAEGSMGDTRKFTPITDAAAEQEAPAPAANAEPEEELLMTPMFSESIAPDEDAIAAHELTYPVQPEETPFSDEAFRVSDDENEEFVFPTRNDTEAVPKQKPQPIRKSRPRRKKGYGLFGIPHILATGVWLAIILVIGITLGRFLWVCAADVLAFGRESSKVSVTITSNDSIEDIAEKLHEAGLVRHPWLFELYAGIAVDEGDILPGTFEMDTLYDYHALVVQMGPRSSNRAVVEDVLIPEGYNCRQIFALLEEKGICTVVELENYAANGEFADFWFLEGVERGDKYCLEGFLFPDTYDFYANSTPREALGKMLLGFENRFTEEIYAQLPALNERLSNMMRSNGCSEEHIAANQLDLRGLLTVASLIEEETASVKENPTIASVIYNRLTQDQEYERYLGIDATILYALGEHTDTLTQEDLNIDSPYNTRTHAGLVPGPITNPGLDSINAALNFEDTNYYYYVLNPETFMHDFSVTLEEHEAKVEKYRAMTATEGE